jgi:hypothetical protein
LQVQDVERFQPHRWRQKSVDQVGFKIVALIKVQKLLFIINDPALASSPGSSKVCIRQNALTRRAFPDCMLSVLVGDHKVLAKPCR